MKKILSFAALLLAFASLSWASFSFSAVAPSGQTLYYTISGSNVSVTYPGSSEYDPWDSYTEPTGALTIPSTVTYNSQTYSVTFIGYYAFSGCSGLTSVTIPNSVTAIDDDAFSGCSGLTSVTIPNSVTYIGLAAFSGCSGLTSVTIPNSVTSIGYQAFYHVRNLIYSGTATGSPWGALCVNGYIEGDLVYTNSSKTHLVGCATTATSVTIPNSVTSIGEWAFYGCSGLTSVTIPNSVTSIGNSAFRGCSSLTSITIPNSVTAIGNYAFYGCSGLTSVTIGNSVTAIGNYAFSGCSGLTSLTIPNSMTSIGEEAFSGCSGLTEITSLASVAPLLGENAFYGVTTTIPVNIPCGRSASYYSRWSYFSNFVESAGFTFSVSSADSTQGIVQVLTQPTCTAPTAVVYATASAGYRFDRWNNGTTANPYTLTVTADTNLVALFVASQQGGDTVYIHDTIYVQQGVDYYNLTVLSDDSLRGLAAGNGFFPVSTEVEIAAIPIQGSHFVQWQDGNTDNPRRVTVTEDAAYTASFDADEVGVANVEAFPCDVTAEEGQIVVKHAANQRIRIFDSVGRLLSTTPNAAEVQTFRMPASGTYLVQVADHPAQKVVVAR